MNYFDFEKLRDTRMSKVYIETYGCTLNKGDSEILLNTMRDMGLIETNKIEDAEIVVINTCTVRKDTEEKILNRIEEISKVYPSKILVVTGCLATAQPYTVKRVAPKAFIVTTYDPVTILRIFQTITGTGAHLSKIDLYATTKGVITIVPIADGCTGFCSFCITRIARPKLISYPMDKILSKVRKSIVKGAREIQLTAQDLGAYGLDIYGRRALIDLVREIINIPGDFMLRIGMINPEHVMHFLDELIEVLKHPKVYKFVHIPLQSGDDRVLKIMNRRYTVDDYRYIVKYIRMKIPDVMIATDIIVGHPGEDEEAFENTLNLLRELEIERIHMAQYTPRPRTLAATLPQIPPHIRKKRSIKLLKLVEEIGEKQHRKYVGSIIRALTTEKGLKGAIIARSTSYYPIVIRDNLELGRWVTVRITDATYYDLRGVVVD